MRRGLIVLVAGSLAAALGVGGALVAHVVAGDDSSSPVIPAVAAAGEVAPGPGSEPGVVAATPGSDRDDADPSSMPQPPAASTTALANADVAAARIAAVAAVARTRDVFEAGAISRHDLVAEFASARFAPELTRRTSQQAMELLFGLRKAEGRAVDVTLTSQPVTAQAHAMTAQRVAVDVWTVSVFVADGQAAAAEQWTTVRLEMVWESSRWLVDTWDTTLGPSPVPAPEGSYATSDEVAAVLSWPAAGPEG